LTSLSSSLYSPLVCSSRGFPDFDLCVVHKGIAVSPPVLRDLRPAPIPLGARTPDRATYRFVIGRQPAAAAPRLCEHFAVEATRFNRQQER
jgi:hypothetical protein